jgi:hypothetical protein
MTTPAPRRPSADARTRRAERADRQAAFAREAGWEAVATLYERLATDLRALAGSDR